MRVIKHTVIALLSFICIDSQAFCGFYVAKAGSKLFNKTSQVILVRDGNLNTVTMSNDFQGDLKEFAMVVPVPVVLNKSNIETVDKSIFSTLDDYSAPRMAKYYDQEPCAQAVVNCDAFTYNWGTSTLSNVQLNVADGTYGVTIEAKYEVDEYDILILSATESVGLEKWLTGNGYKIPDGAQEVLQPYIKSDMKFFVVKVNLARLEAQGRNELKPIRISYYHNKFMLPIRLGMANADGDQDMIVYGFSKKGRIETTNYRNVKIPTDKTVPVFVKDGFGDFYTKVFKTTHKKYNGRVNFLEYSWDVSTRTTVKCDPCVGTPPVNQDLLAAGVGWLNEQNSEVFFTRMHIRYNRQNFPQDLQFQETTNRERFQGRYVINIPASGPFTCESGLEYCKKIKQRRKDEVLELALLTGEDVSNHSDYITEYDKFITDKKSGTISPIILPTSGNSQNGGMGMLFISFLGIIVLALFVSPYLMPKSQKVAA